MTPPSPALQPRCQILGWFADAYRAAIDVADARHAIERHERADADVQRRLSEPDSS